MTVSVIKTATKLGPAKNEPWYLYSRRPQLHGSVKGNTLSEIFKVRQRLLGIVFKELLLTLRYVNQEGTNKRRNR